MSIERKIKGIEREIAKIKDEIFTASTKLKITAKSMNRHISDGYRIILLNKEISENNKHDLKESDTIGSASFSTIATDNPNTVRADKIIEITANKNGEIKGVLVETPDRIRTITGVGKDFIMYRPEVSEGDLIYIAKLEITLTKHSPKNRGSKLIKEATMELVKLIINIDGKEISITPDKAKELQKLFNEIFPTPQPSYWYPGYPWYPSWLTDRYYTTPTYYYSPTASGTAISNCTGP